MTEPRCVKCNGQASITEFTATEHFELTEHWCKSCHRDYVRSEE